MTSLDERAFLADLAADRTVLEIGSWHGGSLQVLAEHATTVHSIDWHKGMDERQPEPTCDTLPKLWANVRRFNNIVLHIGTTEQVAPALRSRLFDLIFIDGTHSKDAVLRDVALLRRTLAPGGVFAFHDYGIGLGVEDAVNELWGKPNMVFQTVAVCG